MYNVILSAYSCHPHKGSEPGVGWNWLKELAKYNKVYLLFYAEQEQAIAVSEEIKKLPYVNNIVLFPISVPKFFQNRFFRLRYEIWQIKAYFVAKRIIKETKIDIIHQVTLATWWFTGYYYFFRDIKKVLGPVSGGQYIPFNAYSFLTTKQKLYEFLRVILLKLFFNLSYSNQQNIKKYDKIFVVNENTYNLFKKYIKNFDNRLFFLSEIGCETNNSILKDKNSSKNVNLIFAGNIIHLKNIGFLLKVMSLIHNEINIQLNIFGSGPLLKYWQKKVEEEKLGNKIYFQGRLSKNELMSVYSKSDIFVFPSLREASGTVILEAMINKLPVIALNLNGAKNIITENCGILIDVISEKQMLNDFANAILKLSKDENLRKSMGENARIRAIEYFSWEQRGLYMQSIYDELMRDKK